MNVDLLLPDQWPIPSKFAMVTCKSCGMVYNDSPVTQDNLSSYYQSKYYSSIDIGFQQSPSRLHDVADYIALHIDPTWSVLEVGCADGKLIQLLDERGFNNTTGIEVGEVPPSHQYDLIIVNHVLEHIGDTFTFVKWLKSHLSPQGCIYIEVPDAVQYYHHIEKPLSFLSFEHCNHFSVATLNHLMGSLGFRASTTFRKTIDISDSLEYPALGGLYKPGTAIWGYDELLAKNTIKYMTKSYDLELNENEQIRNRLNGQTQVAVRGIGHHAFRRLKSTLFDNLYIVAYIDPSPRKQLLTFDSIAVIPPSEYTLPYPIIPLAGSNYVNALIASDCLTRGQNVIEL